MCFTIQKGLEEPIKSSKFINVYKEVMFTIEDDSITIKSPYEYYPYASGTLWQEEELMEKIQEVKEIDGDWPIISECYNVDRKKYGIINKGFHSYIDIGKAPRPLITYAKLCDALIQGIIHNTYNAYLLVAAVIPKGAEFFINTDIKEVVSNKIMLTGNAYVLDNLGWIRTIPLIPLIKDMVNTKIRRGKNVLYGKKWV